MFFNGANIGSPRSPLHSIPPAYTTNIVDSQQDIGCFRENARAPTEKKEKEEMFINLQNKFFEKETRIDLNDEEFKPFLAFLKNLNPPIFVSLIVRC